MNYSFHKNLRIDDNILIDLIGVDRLTFRLVLTPPCSFEEEQSFMLRFFFRIGFPISSKNFLLSFTLRLSGVIVNC